MLKHLRIFFFAFISLTLTQSMMAADLKVYGKVSKELQFVDQDEKFNFKSHVGVVENENSESRLGAMGSHVFDDIEVKYHLELGINSSRQDKTAGTNTTTYKDTSGRIRIRQSNIKLKSYWGEFTFGQAWTPTAWLQVSVFDPLASTGAGLHALSHDTLIATPVTLLGLGTSYRGRKDGWGYETPSWAGLKFTLWTDHNDD
ncbi:MAG: porin, partial [Bdellovibrionales bacterium]|nr:porin [Bdellovibrionales bacterium]